MPVDPAQYVLSKRNTFTGLNLNAVPCVLLYGDFAVSEDRPLVFIKAVKLLAGQDS